MHKYFVVILLGLLFALTACVRQIDSSIMTVNGYTDGVSTNGQGLELSGLRMVPLEVTSETALSSVRSIGFLNDMILVQGDDKLLCFDRDGHFLHTVGQRGKGHGEYLRINSFFADEKTNTVILFDETLSRLLVFDSAGQLIRTQDVDREDAFMLHRIQPCGNGKYLADHYIYNDYKDIYVVHDFDNHHRDVINESPMRTANTAEAIASIPFSRHHGKISCLLPFDPCIYTLDTLTFSLYPSVRVDIGTAVKLFTSKQQSEVTDFSIMTKATLMNEGYFTGFSGILETDHHILLDMDRARYFLIDKRSQNGRLYSASIDSESGCVPLINMQAADDSLFVGVIEPFKAASLVEASKNIPPQKQNRLLIQLNHLMESGVRNDENPILIFYHLK